MADLPNHIVELNGRQFKIDFSILSETSEHLGKRILKLVGVSEDSKIYTAIGTFEPDFYKLMITNLQEV